MDKIPDIVPNDCTKYSLARIHSSKSQQLSTQHNKCAPRENMRPRTFDVCGVGITLPENKFVYAAVEVCSILTQIKEDAKKDKVKKAPSINKIICAMKDYKDGSLIPCSLPTMYRILKKFETNQNIEWPTKGRPPILSNSNMKVVLFQKMI